MQLKPSYFLHMFLIKLSSNYFSQGITMKIFWLMISLHILVSQLVFAQIINNGFESGTVNWTGDINLTISEEGTTVYEGVRSLNCTYNSNSGSNCDLRSDLISGISGSTSYNVSAWFYDNDIAGRANLVIYWYDNLDQIILINYSASYTITQASWQQSSYTATSPANAVKCAVGSRFYPEAGNWDGDCTIYVDAFSGSPSPLPVELTSFSATTIGSTVRLSWNTATEINNYGFEVERCVLSPERQTWNKIGFVNGNGNSNSPKNYSFVDDKVSAGKYSYRLKQIDDDGQFEYSKTIEVDFNSPKKFELTQNYPNPFNPITTISWEIPTDGLVTLKIFDILGKEIYTIADEYQQAGSYQRNFDGSSLSSGMYFFTLQSGSFVQTRKMILMK